MAEQRRPTARIGRRSKDPRIDSVPPTREPEAVSLPPSERSAIGRLRKPDGAVQVQEQPEPIIVQKGGSVRVRELEGELANERAERAAEADLLGQILARATQAEARVKLLEQTLARVNEERAMAEAQLQTLRGEIDRLLADRKSSYEEQSAALADSRATDSKPHLRAMRTLAQELLQTLDALLGGHPSRPPSSSHSRPPSAGQHPRAGSKPPSSLRSQSPFKSTPVRPQR